MKFRELGKSGVKVSEIILGCWVMGGDYWGGAQDNESVGAINEALSKGINTFDTAEIYGSGRSEEVLGQALIGKRDNVVLSSKVFTHHMKKADAIKACEDSLKRLHTDYVDIYFIHYPSENGTVPIEETMDAMNVLKKEGKIRAIGLSNLSLKQIKEAAQFGVIDVIQPCYSLVWRYIDDDIIPYCIEHNIGIVPYSPLAQGILTGKFSSSTVFKEDDGRSHAPLFQEPWFEMALEVAEKVKPYADKYKKTLAQTSINWLNNAAGITASIVGGRNARQVSENIGAVGWKLSEEDMSSISHISKVFTVKLPHFKNFFDNTIIEED